MKWLLAAILASGCYDSAERAEDLLGPDSKCYPSGEYVAVCDVHGQGLICFTARTRRGRRIDSGVSVVCIKGFDPAAGVPK